MRVNGEFEEEKNLMENRQVFKECTGLTRARDGTKKEKKTGGGRQVCLSSPVNPTCPRLTTAHAAQCCTSQDGAESLVHRPHSSATPTGLEALTLSCLL